MSWAALAWAKDAHAGNHVNKLVLVMLAECHNEETGVAYPSVQWLSDHCEMSRRTVQRALRDLEHRGLIEWDGRWAGVHADRQTKRYRLPLIHTGRQSDAPGASESHDGASHSPNGASQRRPNLKEPTKNHARKRTRPVENLSRPALPSPEDTLRMLKEERT